MSALIERGLHERMVATPQAAFDVIVRTEGEAGEVAAACARQGMTVHHTYRLVPGFALTATGAALLALATHPQVMRIEPDQPVSV